MNLVENDIGQASQSSQCCVCAPTHRDYLLASTAHSLKHPKYPGCARAHVDSETSQNLRLGAVPAQLWAQSRRRCEPLTAGSVRARARDPDEDARAPLQRPRLLPAVHRAGPPAVLDVSTHSTLCRRCTAALMRRSAAPLPPERICVFPCGTPIAVSLHHVVSASVCMCCNVQDMHVNVATYNRKQERICVWEDYDKNLAMLEQTM
jgi:hypothetical protein